MAARLFDRLKEAAGPEWTGYTRHEFVRRLGDGSLPEASFRHYLIQDYLFLIHFARAYALAVYKSDTLADMRQAGASLSAILDLEMGLHVRFCAGWGLDEAAMAASPEATGTLAYTRYVLERGTAGDLLDLHVALAPCIVGYAEIAAELTADPATRLEGNPYRAWIEMYAGEEYRAVAAAEMAQLDSLYARRGGEARFPDLARTFTTASRLEAGFWEMGLKLLP
ncbi:thiaminase II [Skermanella pratensis]|uniref:thiaminase II n=1 Tax=Skermanella pratensis TaxID=2233999 RepID=UPI0013015C3E|nr:thiaminase II [Skermanella pratensis]